METPRIGTVLWFNYDGFKGHRIYVGGSEPWRECDSEGWVPVGGMVPEEVERISFRWSRGVLDMPNRLRVRDTSKWDEYITHWRPSPAADAGEPPTREEQTLPPPDTSPIDAAFDTLKAAMQCPEYAWSWHCNLVVFKSGESHEEANRRAATLMRHIWDIDVTTFDMWKDFERQWADEKKPKAPAGLMVVAPIWGPR